MVDAGDDRPVETLDRPNAIERIIFSRVELWVVVVLLLFGCLVTIGFGAAVLDAEREDFRLGAISRAALTVAEIPQTAKRILNGDSDLRIKDSDRERANPTGWSFPSGPLTEPSGYLLISRYDGTDKRQRIELVALPAMHTVYRWTSDAAELLKDVTRISRFAETTNWSNSRFREYHPWIEANGDLIIKDYDCRCFALPRAASLSGHSRTQNSIIRPRRMPRAICGFSRRSERPSIASVNERSQDNRIDKISPSGKLLLPVVRCRKS